MTVTAERSLNIDRFTVKTAYPAVKALSPSPFFNSRSQQNNLCLLFYLYYITFFYPFQHLNNNMKKIFKTIDKPHNKWYNKSAVRKENISGCSSVWLERYLGVVEAGSSSLLTQTKIARFFVGFNLKSGFFTPCFMWNIPKLLTKYFCAFFDFSKFSPKKSKNYFKTNLRKYILHRSRTPIFQTKYRNIRSCTDVYFSLWSFYTKT